MIENYIPQLISVVVVVLYFVIKKYVCKMQYNRAFNSICHDYEHKVLNKSQMIGILRAYISLCNSFLALQVSLSVSFFAYIVLEGQNVDNIEAFYRLYIISLSLMLNISERFLLGLSISNLENNKIVLRALKSSKLLKLISMICMFIFAALILSDVNILFNSAVCAAGVLIIIYVISIYFSD